MEKLRRMVQEIAYTQDYANLPTLHRSLIPVLSFASSIYSLALALRRSLYKSSLLSTHRLPVPVISVGNLTWGGNGKTPMVEFISLFLSDSRISPLILTRGYGGGDEVRMLTRHLITKPDVKIGVGPSRAATAAAFLKKYGYVTEFPPPCGCLLEKVGAVVLDDGMQHWSLQRDVEIVMVNALMPWGNNQLLPLGPLREPLTALTRANAGVIHHADLVSKESLEDIELMMRRVNECLPIFFTRMCPSHFFEVGNINSRIPLDVANNAVVLCVSAIGSADAFVRAMEKIGAFYVGRADFSDHHLFQARDIETMKIKLRELENFLGSRPVVVITEKDYDRDPEILQCLRPYKVMVLCSELQIISSGGQTEESFKKLLKELLEVRLRGGNQD